MSSLTIPAAYLGDVRSALLSVLADDHQALREAEGPADCEPRTLILQRDSRLLAAVSEATGDVELSAESDRLSSPLVEVLEAMVRQLTERLAGAVQYGPAPMGDVLDTAERLRWAAQEAIRIDPDMDFRLSAKEWEMVA